MNQNYQDRKLRYLCKISHSNSVKHLHLFARCQKCQKSHMEYNRYQALHLRSDPAVIDNLQEDTRKLYDFRRVVVILAHQANI